MLCCAKAMKTCKTCGETKSSIEFSKTGRPKNDGTYGLRVDCNPCYRRKANLRRAKDLQKYNLWSKYRLTEEAYRDMVNKFDGACWACGEKHPRMCVDHDHACCDREGSCGKCVRGLLCDPCNRALGTIGDDANRLQMLINYLTKL